MPPSPSSPRRQAADGGGKLTKDSTIVALKEMGFTVDSKGRIDPAAARQVAEGATISAAAALGVDIRKPNGQIDTAKARGAIAEMLGVNGSGKPSQADKAAQPAATERSQQAAIAAAQALGVDIRDANGSINPTQARQVIDIALNVKTIQAQKLGRREAVTALNTSLNAMTTTTAASRRDASDAIAQLLSSSVLVDGKINRRQARKALDQTLSLP